MDNIQSVVLFLSGSSLGASLIIGLFKNWIKNTLAPRFGDLGVQAVLFGIALCISALAYGSQFFPKALLLMATTILIGANAIYQVLYKTIIKKAILGKLDTDEVK